MSPNDVLLGCELANPKLPHPPTAILTHGVWRTIPLFFGPALADVTMPLAMRPDPPSFSLAKMKIVSPLANALAAIQ